MFKTIPFLTRKELREILENCTREGDCLFHNDHYTAVNNIVRIRGTWFVLSRVMWAEQKFDVGGLLATHEVIHKSCCPNPGGDKTKRVCINVEHLELSPFNMARVANMKERERKHL
jgi:hypothetical protein